MDTVIGTTMNFKDGIVDLDQELIITSGEKKNWVRLRKYLGTIKSIGKKRVLHYQMVIRTYPYLKLLETQ